MTFLNPLLLFGGAAIAAPIVIHLYMNRRVKRVVWAAMRFLQSSVEKNQKRLNLEDRVLLALRCLLLILLALALARPLFGGAGGGASAARGAETAVIALDHSFSMSQSEGGTSRFDQARKAAEQVIDQLPAGSSVAVLLFSDVVQPLVAEPTFDLNLARKVIREAKLSSRPTRVQPAILRAFDTLRRRGATGSTLYLITDGQANGWAPLEETVKSLTTPAVSTRLILVGAPEEHNLAVSDLRLAGAIANVVSAAQFDVEVANFGVAEATAVAVKLSIDDEPPSDEGAIPSIPAGAARRLSLYARFRVPGYHTVTARINPDALPADDQRTLAVRALDDVRVLLVDGAPAAEARESSTFYLRHALTPVAAADREHYFVKTRTISPAELTSTKLDDWEAVVLANVPSLPPAAVEGLTEYLKRGGGLIVFPGEKVDASFYNEVLGRKLGLLPAELGAIRGEAEKREQGFTLQAKDYRHPIVSLWNDPGAGTLATAQFFRAFTLKPLAGAEPATVLSYADGSPAVIEHTWGRGKVILFSSSADTTWNDLPLRPAFVPLLARTLGSILQRQDARLNLPVGAKFEYVCEPDWLDKDARIAGPGETRETAALRRIGLSAGVPTLQFDQTSQAGPYEITVKTEPVSTVKFATQADLAESNLTELTKPQLESLGAAAQVVHWDEHGALGFKGAGGEGGWEAWTWLAAAALLLACVEVSLAATYSASK